MALKIYISYGTPDDQVTALRLQALAAVNDFPAYVPPVHTRKKGKLDAISLERLKESDVYFGLAPFSSVCQEELTVAKNRRQIILLLGDYGADLEPYHLTVQAEDGFGPVVDIREPEKAEARIGDYLSRLSLPESKKRSLRGLATVAMGLLILAPEAHASR